jgi:hypothetical protein
MIRIDDDYSPYWDESDPVGYPGGKAKPVSQGNRTDGTPWRALLFNTIMGFFQAIIVEAYGEFTVDGQPDKVGQSDLLNAIKNLMSKAVNPEIDGRITQNTLDIGGNTSNINYLLQYVTGLVEEAPNDGRTYNRKSRAWVESAGGGGSAFGDSVKAFKFYSDKTLMVTNARIADRRSRGWDIGRPYLSAAHEVYHFDTDIKNQQQVENITLGYTGEAPILVGKDDVVENIYFNPAVKDLGPCEPDGRSLYGRFSLSAGIEGEAATVEFWMRLFAEENSVIFRLGSALDEIELRVGGLETKYHIPRGEGYAYHVPRPEEIPYSVQKNFSNTLEHNYQGGSETIDLDELGVAIQSGVWIHVAAVSTLGTMSLFIDGTRVDVTKQSATAQNMTLEINEDEQFFNLDELSLVSGTALLFEDFTATGADRVPYAALNHEEPWGVFEAQDPAKVKTNLFAAPGFRETVLAIINEASGGGT